MNEVTILFSGNDRKVYRDVLHAVMSTVLLLHFHITLPLFPCVRGEKSAGRDLDLRN